MKITITSLAITCLLAGMSQAAVVAQYDMATLTISGTTSTSPNVVVNPNVTAADFTENLTGGTSQTGFGRQGSGLVPAGVNGAISQRAGWIDNVTLTADVTVVPEPTTGLLGAFGLLTLLRRKR